MTQPAKPPGSQRLRTSFWLDGLPLALQVFSILLSLAMAIALCFVQIDRGNFYVGALGLSSILYMACELVLAAVSGALTLANMCIRDASDRRRRAVRNGWLLSMGLFVAMLLLAGTLIQVRLASGAYGPSLARHGGSSRAASGPWLSIVINAAAAIFYDSEQKPFENGSINAPTYV